MRKVEKIDIFLLFEQFWSEFLSWKKKGYLVRELKKQTHVLDIEEKESLRTRAWAFRNFSPKNDQNGKIIYHKKKERLKTWKSEKFVLTSLTFLICISRSFLLWFAGIYKEFVRKHMKEMWRLKIIHAIRTKKRL